MTTKAKFLAMADAAGCAVDYWRADGSVWCVLWAPDGMAFISSGCACDASFNSMTTASGGAIDWPVACSALADVIREGFTECDAEA